MAELEKRPITKCGVTQLIMINLIKPLRSTRYYIPSSHIHTRFRNMSIKVGDTIPSGTFGTILYTPALDDAVGFQVVPVSR